MVRIDGMAPNKTRGVFRARRRAPDLDPCAWQVVIQEAARRLVVDGLDRGEDEVA